MSVLRMQEYVNIHVCVYADALILGWEEGGGNT